MTATASDNIGVTKVEFYLNGALKATDTASPYSYAWDTRTAANGSYTLTAKAYDAAGNVGQAGNVVVTVNNPDTTAPTVSVTAPANNATVSGTATVTATASDNIGVTKVEFYLNGVLKATDTAGPYSYAWDTRTAANGSYTLIARAYDAAGNVGQTGNVVVTVNNPDITAPTISVTAPANNATVSGTVTVTADSSDLNGVTKVEVYLNGTLKATDTTVPYSYAWDTQTVANGSYTLTAKAYDAAGNVGQAGNVVTVFNTPISDIPKVTITAPANNATVRNTVTVSANASDNVGVTKVEFYVNGSLYATTTTAPYSLSVATTEASNGSYTLIAKAYDAAGNVGQSEAVPFTIQNALFPSTGILDNFNRPNQILSASTSWLEGITGEWDVASSHAQPTTTGPNAAMYNVDFTSDQEAYFTVITKPTINDTTSLGFFLRMNTTAKNGHMVTLVTESGSDVVRIWTVTGGIGNQLGVDFPCEFGVGDKFWAKAVGNIITVYRLASGSSVWVQVAQLSNALYIQGGKIGIYGSGNTGALDDFGGGSLTN